MGVIQLQDIRDEVIQLYKDGGGKVYYCGFKKLAPHYNIKEGSCTDWTGYPGSGKTELLFELLKNCSEYYDHKHLIYMPDAGSNAEVIAKLLHKFSGKQFHEHYYDSLGQRQEIEYITGGG
jgi:primosomal protein N'